MALDLENIYMTATEVKTLFKVNRMTVTRWRESGKLKGGVKVGKEYRYPTKNVMALMGDDAAAELKAMMEKEQNNE